MATQRWAVIDLHHRAVRGVRDDCKDCLALAEAAIADARATGSSGATRAVAGPPGMAHSVTVRRIIKVVNEP